MKKISLYWVIVAAVLLIGILPYGIFAINSHWSYVDDGYGAYKADLARSALLQFDVKGFLTNLTENYVSRFRPMYIFYEVVTFSIFSTNSYLDHLFKIIVLFLVGLFSVRHLLLWTENKFLSLVGGFLVVTSTFMAENTIRLGPAEFVSLIFFALILFFHDKLIRVKFSYWQLVLLAIIGFCAALTKEVYIIILPFLAGYFVLSAAFQKSEKIEIFKKIIFSMVLFGILILTFVLLYFDQKQFFNGSYINSYQFSKAIIHANYANYLDILWKNEWFQLVTAMISTLFFVNLMLVKKYRNQLLNNNRYQIILFYWSLLFGVFIPLLPWGVPLTRYIVIFSFLLTLYSILVTKEIYRIFQNQIKVMKSLKLKIILSLVIFILLIPQISNSLIVNVNAAILFQKTSEFDYQFTEAIVKSVPTGSKVLYNFNNNDNNVEVVYETDKHLKYFHSSFKRQPKYAEDECKSEENRTDLIYVLQRPGDVYQKMPFNNQVIDSGKVDIKLINQDPFAYNWSIYTTTLKDICKNEIK